MYGYGRGCPDANNEFKVSGMSERVLVLGVRMTGLGLNWLVYGIEGFGGLGCGVQLSVFKFGPLCFSI